jgi:Reverse transcriptase (RNA-dependent DNA polymerase)
VDEVKPFDIPKREVWAAFRKVKANQGAAGVDGQSIADFEADLSNNLYELWNRLSSGSYFPPPVRRVDIPKVDGGTRALGIPTVADRVAQEVARRYLEPRLEPVFHADSYGYRPGKSAIDAVRRARQRCWRYDWVLDLDVKAYFDSIDWELMLRAVRRHTNQPSDMRRVWCHRQGKPERSGDVLMHSLWARETRSSTTRPKLADLGTLANAVGPEAAAGRHELSAVARPLHSLRGRRPRAGVFRELQAAQLVKLFQLLPLPSGSIHLVTKALFVTTEGNTNARERSAAPRHRGSRGARSVRLGRRAGGHRGHFAV